jgi:nicotinamidase-related amidase
MHVPPAPGLGAQGDSPENFPIPPRAVHLCLDMQNLIGPNGPWAAKWAERVLPQIVSLVEHAPARCIFTRFVPPRDAEAMPGAWRAFYRKWPGLTASEINPEAIELLDPLKLFTPPALVLDKTRFSAFSIAELAGHLRSMGADALILSGAESDMCVLSTLLSAVDLGFPVVVATDAICSSADSCHDAVLELYHQRFSQQVHAMTVPEIKEAWAPA